MQEIAEQEACVRATFRHSFASVGAGSGHSPLMIGALLGHKDAKTTARYAHLAADPVKLAADTISKKIAEVLG